MVRRYGISLIACGIFSIMAAGSALAWPRVGILPQGPAWNRGPVAEKGGKIDAPENSKNVGGSPEYDISEPLGTGDLSESAQPRSGGDRKMKDGIKIDRQYIDVGP